MRNKVSEIKISYNKSLFSLFGKTTIKSSLDVSKLLYNHWDKNTIGLQESFKVVLLNNSNMVKGIYEHSKGGISETIVDLRILFATVLKSLSVAIILAHNHPSGKLKPSEADKQLTKKIIKVASFHQIKVLDHLIVTPDGEYYSFSDDGML